MTDDLFFDNTNPEVPQKQPSFLGVDFFCGAGGTTRGMIDAGGYVIAGVDKDDNCSLTYTKNNGNETLDGRNAQFLHRDIFDKTELYPDGEKQLLVEELHTMIKKARKAAPEAPLMFAICAPCQPFTGLSRKSLGKEREAGRLRDRNLLLEAGKVVKRFMPEIVVSENVAGIKEDKFGGVWGEFSEMLESMGYVVGSQIVSTEKFGIAQARRRSILVAILRKSLADKKVKAISIPLADPKAIPMSVKEAIGHYPPLKDGEVHPTISNHRTASLSDLNRRRISYAKPGEKNDYLWDTPEGDLSLKCHRDAKTRESGVHRTFTDVYTRMDPSKPSPTITTNCHSISNGRFGHFDVTQNRAISLREAAELQSFSEEYVFYPEEKTGLVARMIGNAVPPKLSKFFAEYAVGLTVAGKKSSDE